MDTPPSGHTDGAVDIATMPMTAAHYRVFAAAAMGQMSGQGLTTLVGIIIPMMQLVMHPGLSALMQGVLGCVSLVGLALGALVLGHLSDRYGYLLFFRLCPALMLVASVGAWLYHPLWALVIWLFLMGMSIGGEYSLDSDYISELMPDRWKLLMTGAAKATASVGSALVAGVCLWAISVWQAARIWPWLLLVMGALAAVSLLLRVGFPQSPEWLMHHGMTARAEEAVKRLYGPRVFIAPDVSPGKTPRASGILDFISRNRSKVLFTGMPWACEGLGVYGIGIFLPILVMSLGLQHDSAGATPISHVRSSVEITMWLSVIMAMGFAVGLSVVQRVYHIRLEAAGFIMSAVALLVLAGAEGWHSPRWVSLVAFMIFEFSLNAGPHLVTYILPPQVYPVNERGTGAGVAACIGKSGAIAGAFLIPLLLKWGGAMLVLFVSAGVMALGAVITLAVGPKVLPPAKNNSQRRLL